MCPKSNTVKMNMVMNIGVVNNESDAFYGNSGLFNQNSWSFDAISLPFDTIYGAKFKKIYSI